MSTFKDDIIKNTKDPQLLAAYDLIGYGRPKSELRNMVKALNIHPFLNTAEDTARLGAAKYILKEGAI